jgi:hypothetical protein
MNEKLVGLFAFKLTSLGDEEASPYRSKYGHKEGKSAVATSFKSVGITGAERTR